MERIVKRFSIVYIASGEEIEVFPSLEEVPEEKRQRLIRTLRTSHVDTLIIANEKGRELLQSNGWREAALPPAEPKWEWTLSVKVAIGCLLAGTAGLVILFAWQLR